jgi:hypothetical protein
MAPKNVRGKLIYSLSDPTIVGLPSFSTKVFDISSHLDISIAKIFVLNEKKKILKSGIKRGSTEYIQHFMQLYMDYHKILYTRSHCVTKPETFLNLLYVRELRREKLVVDSFLFLRNSGLTPSQGEDVLKRKKNYTIMWGMSAYWEYKYISDVMDAIIKLLKYDVPSTCSPRVT